MMFKKKNAVIYGGWGRRCPRLRKSRRKDFSSPPHFVGKGMKDIPAAGGVAVAEVEVYDEQAQEIQA